MTRSDNISAHTDDGADGKAVCQEVDCVNQRLVKFFEDSEYAPEGWYYGTVVSFEHPYFDIVYDDQDKESMSVTELQDCFNNYKIRSKDDPNFVQQVSRTANNTASREESSPAPRQRTPRLAKTKQSDLISFFTQSPKRKSTVSAVSTASKRTKPSTGKAALSNRSEPCAQDSLSEEEGEEEDEDVDDNDNDDSVYEVDNVESESEHNSDDEAADTDSDDTDFKAEDNLETPSLTVASYSSSSTNPKVEDSEMLIDNEVAQRSPECTKDAVNKFNSLFNYSGGKKSKPKAPSDRKNKGKVAQKSKASVSNPSHAFVKVPYDKGIGLPIITEPQLMFDDMIKRNLCEDGKACKMLLPMIKKFYNRPLRVATMCSGTESPILALDMMQKSIRDICHSSLQNELAKSGIDINRVFEIQHVFSCEIEPFKQAYIERNFHPPILFRDIRELGNDQANTAYGALVDVPSQVDLLVAGTSCVDYSGLNNKKKGIKDNGESGQTFEGMMKWVEKAQPPIVIIENVSGAPWETMVKFFEKRDYAAAFTRIDTKDYYIPQTRQRGYLIAVKSMKIGKKIPDRWSKQVKALKRPASAPLDAFMLSSDDPRVLRGRQRLTAESRGQDGGDRAGRTDWTKCETRHQFARSEEELGDQRPLTGWSDSGKTTMPSFAWNDWCNSQVHRIHDLMDINTLRMAQSDMDCTYKTMVWNLSQNVDRDTMGRLGLCQCLTPTGVPYISSRGGPLVGEELLALQGIPARDLLFTKESEDHLKDLAGNAMSTTVVGATIISALLTGCEMFKDATGFTDKNKNIVVMPSLVPRPYHAVTDTMIQKQLGTYYSMNIDLGSKLLSVDAWRLLLDHADRSTKQCLTESSFECTSVSNLARCKQCGYSTKKENAYPVRKFESHEFEDWPEDSVRLDPELFRHELLSVIPMIVCLGDLSFSEFRDRSTLSDKDWTGWLASVTEATCNSDDRSVEYRFTHVHRSEVWTVHYKSDKSSRLELRVTKDGLEWLLFLNRLDDTGHRPLFDTLPIARLKVPLSFASKDTIDVTQGSWEVRVPTKDHVTLHIQGVGDKVASWRNRMGLKGQHESEYCFEQMIIRIEGDTEIDPLIKSRVEGSYKALPKCGTACGSLYQKNNDGTNERPTYFYLESGRNTLTEHDSFVFSDSCRRSSYGVYKDVFMMIDPTCNYRHTFNRPPEGYSTEVRARLPGRWMLSSLIKVLNTEAQKHCTTALLPQPNYNASITNDFEGKRSAALVVDFTLSSSKLSSNFLSSFRFIGDEMELNLQKASAIFQDFTYITSRIDIPSCFADDRWLKIRVDYPGGGSEDDVPCTLSAPIKPSVYWSLVKKGKNTKYIPVEDGREAAKFERDMKSRPEPWIVRLKTNTDLRGSSYDTISLSIGCNVVTLVNRALGCFNVDSLSRKITLEYQTKGAIDASIHYDWRIVKHIDKSIPEFCPLQFKSNKADKEADQPPNFARYKLRKEQLRSLQWMLNQESSIEPFYEEEVAESILPSMAWRVEGRTQRPVIIRGGIIADEVGYGKTAISLGLIDSTKSDMDMLEQVHPSLIRTRATLVIVPGHLMDQWPSEIKKFLGSTKKVVVIKNMQSFNTLTIENVVCADIVIVNFTVLSGSEYFERLANLCGVDGSCLPSGNSYNRLFSAVYNQCMQRLEEVVDTIVNDTVSADQSLQDRLREHKSVVVTKSENVVMDRKKSAYKDSSMPTSNKSNKKKLVSSKDVSDPWKLKSALVKKSYKRMQSPPLELFFWNRVIVDEFTYLNDNSRGKVLCMILGLKSCFRWCLSGTPRHSTFDDIQNLSSLLGIHLGIDETLPGTKLRGKSNQASSDATSYESLSLFLETRSMQWHERRHELAQLFLNRFVRQNKAEHDEIPSLSRIYSIDLPPAERAIYLELETHLKSLEMNSKSAQKSKKQISSDRDSRMQHILQNSSTAEEALLKCSSHFNFSSENSTALETIRDIVKLRKSQIEELVRELIGTISAAFFQEKQILLAQPSWAKVKKSEKGEVENALNRYKYEVAQNDSVPHGADDEVHTKIKEILANAERKYNTAPTKCAKYYNAFYVKSAPTADDDDDLDEDSHAKPSKKQKRVQKSKSVVSPDVLYAMKIALRNHMHMIRSLGKELCGRIRSLRYVDWIRQFQVCGSSFVCRKCGKTEIAVEQMGVLSCCGHVGCIECLNLHASNGVCIESPSCSARVSPAHVVQSSDLGLDKEESASSTFGCKLKHVIETVGNIIRKGDRLIIFCQFDDLSQKVVQALAKHNITAVQVQGSVNQKIKILSKFQMEVPNKDDPRVLMLKLDDEQSAGLNLTNLNHAVFIHPLLANSQAEYDAYETQAIGRIRRYGQTKTVYIHRFLAKGTIDTEIYSERTAISLDPKTRVLEQS